MTPQHAQLLDSFYAATLGAEWKRTAKPSFLTGWEVTEALWPMNSMFRQHHAQISSLAYQPSLEDAADDAISALVFGKPWTVDDPSPGVWRVLLERHLQSVALALANERAGNARVVMVPSCLPKSLRLQAAMLFLQYQMALPFPVQDRADHVWPQGPLPSSLRQH